MKNAWLLVALILVAGCTRGLDHKLDGSSEQKFASSLGKMRESASPDDVKRLDDALRVLAVSDVSIGFEGGILGALAKLEAKSPESLAEVLLPKVNGRTGREVVEAGAARKREQAQRQLTATLAEIAALTRARTEKEKAREILAKIEVMEPRIGIAGEGGSRMGILDFKVLNGTEESLASLFLRATVTGAGGEVLVTDEFTYKASPPITAGQNRGVRLPSSSPGKWNSPQLAKQSALGLQLSVENAQTPAGQKLAASFTQKDAERLAVLEKNKPLLETIVAAK